MTNISSRPHSSMLRRREDSLESPASPLAKRQKTCEKQKPKNTDNKIQPENSAVDRFWFNPANHDLQDDIVSDKAESVVDALAGNVTTTDEDDDEFGLLPLDTGTYDSHAYENLLEMELCHKNEIWNAFPNRNDVCFGIEGMRYPGTVQWWKDLAHAQDLFDKFSDEVLEYIRNKDPDRSFWVLEDGLWRKATAREIRHHTAQRLRHQRRVTRRSSTSSSGSAEISRSVSPADQTLAVLSSDAAGTGTKASSSARSLAIRTPATTTAAKCVSQRSQKLSVRSQSMDQAPAASTRKTVAKVTATRTAMATSAAAGAIPAAGARSNMTQGWSDFPADFSASCTYEYELLMPYAVSPLPSHHPPKDIETQLRIQSLETQLQEKELDVQSQQLEIQSLVCQVQYLQNQLHLLRNASACSVMHSHQHPQNNVSRALSVPNSRSGSSQFAPANLECNHGQPIPARALSSSGNFTAGSIPRSPKAEFDIPDHSS